MGACSTLGRVVLVILNILFLLVSLALIAGGSILKFTPSVIMSFLTAGIDSLVPTSAPTSSSAPLIIPQTLDFVPMFGDIGIVLLVSGIVLFILSFLACCGACCKWRPFLIVFVIVMIVIIVVLAVMGALLLVKDSILHKNIRNELADKAVKEYKKDKTGAFSQIMNLLAMKMDCCGFSGPGDYDEDWENKLKIVTPLPLPLSCCSAMNASCVFEATTNFYRQEGCYSKLTKMLEDNKTWAIIVLVCLLVLMLLEVIFSIVIVVDVGSNKVGPV